MTVTSLVLQARNCTILRAGAGLPPVASTPHTSRTRRPCWLTARSLLQQALITPAVTSGARNCTTRQAGAGFAPSASTPHGTHTRRPCCPTGRSLLQGVWIIQIIPWLLRVRNSTILHRLQQHHRRPPLPRLHHHPQPQLCLFSRQRHHQHLHSWLPPHSADRRGR